MSTPVSLQVYFYYFLHYPKCNSNNVVSALCFILQTMSPFFLLQISYGIIKHIFSKVKPPLNFAVLFVLLLLQRQPRRRKGSEGSRRHAVRQRGKEPRNTGGGAWSQEEPTFYCGKACYIQYMFWRYAR